jgi:hypothetical protein
MAKLDALIAAGAEFDVADESYVIEVRHSHSTSAGFLIQQVATPFVRSFCKVRPRNINKGQIVRDVLAGFFFCLKFLDH